VSSADGQATAPASASGATPELPDPSATSKVLWEVVDERGRQDAKWGEQNHPLVDTDVRAYMALGDSPHDTRRVRAMAAAQWYRVPMARTARELCQEAARGGRSTWTDILLEEFCEFLEAAALGEDADARTELLQLAAVAVAAVQAIDRRAK